MVNIMGCGFFFPFPVPPDEVICAMKISAMLSRNKGRDFYDVMFLLSQTTPDYAFLSQKCGINNTTDLKNSVNEMLKTVDLKVKIKDFEHLLFNKEKSKQILHFFDFINKRLI
jgi:predicted nucleotidyltransferase component of viral defense system